MKSPDATGVVSRLIDLAGRLINLAALVIILLASGLFAFVCFFGVVVQIVDEGGGASGILTRRSVTVGQRVLLGTVFGSLGCLSIFVAARVSILVPLVRIDVKPSPTAAQLGLLDQGPKVRDRDGTL